MNELLAYAADLAEFDVFWWRDQYHGRGHLRAYPHDVVVVDYDRLCADPRPTLAVLGGALDVEDRQALTALAGGIRRPTAYAAPDGKHDQDLMLRAVELHDAVRGMCINHGPGRAPARPDVTGPGSRS